MKPLTIKFLILGCVLLATTFVSAQTNLLLNENANFESEHWRAMKEATVEEFNGDKVFVVRNGGYFYQDVKVTDVAIGKYALFIGRGSSERVNADGTPITGLPYLYGYMLDSDKSSDGIVRAYLQGQKMRGDTRVENEWVVMYGIFQVPKQTSRIRFFLNQAEQRDVPQNGSAARFDNLGLYLFETEKDALEFARAYK